MSLVPQSWVASNLEYKGKCIGSINGTKGWYATKGFGRGNFSSFQTSEERSKCIDWLL